MMKAAFLAVFLLGPAPVRAGAPPAQEEAAAPAPVRLGDREVLVVQDRLLSLSAQERAERVSQRLLKVARNPLADIESMAVHEGESTSDIALGDFILMSVTDRDAARAGMPRAALAERTLATIKSSLREYRKERGLRSLVIGVFLAGLFTFLFVLTQKYLAKGHAAARARLAEWGPKHLPSLRLQSIELLPSDRLLEGLQAGLDLLYWAFFALIVYFYIPTILSFFPWTRGVSERLFAYVLSPLKAVVSAVAAYIPNLFFIAVVIFVIHHFLRFVHMIFREVARERVVFPGFHPEWAEPTYQIARFLIWAFALVVVFPYLPGAQSDAFKGVSVFIGVLFSIGSSSAVSNVVAGTILTYMRPFRIGDRVKIADAVGDVVEKTLLVTRLKTIKNVYITIPNAAVLAGQMVNYTRSENEEGLILHTSVTIGYDAPWRKVHELLVSAAKATPTILSEPAPFVLQTALGDFSVSYEINAYTDDPAVMARTYSALHANIQDRFSEAGIEIMSPTFEVRRDGPTSTLPPRG